jgi:septum formation protein
MAAEILTLASASPRRRELLAQIGVAHAVLKVDVDESVLPGENPEAYVARLAAMKAAAGWDGRRGQGPVLGADTAVVLGREILGKPKDRADGAQMLARLSGRSHRVLTAVVLRSSAGLARVLSDSSVTFRVIRPDEISAYWDSGEPRDKAGGYAVQGLGAVFIAALSGSYSGVMGLPLFETAQLLEAAGVALFNGRHLA